MREKRPLPCWNRGRPRSRNSFPNRIDRRKQFAHDAVGNQIERPNQTITYTDWDLPRQYIPKGGGVPTTFEYLGTGGRVRRIRSESETVYVGDLYEQETNGNTVTERFYVHNDERVVAIVERAASGDFFPRHQHVGVSYRRIASWPTLARPRVRQFRATQPAV